jgi:hypothetical protein
MFKLEEMEPISQEIIDQYPKNSDGTFNPFHIDSFSMGRQFCKDIYFMYSQHKDQDYRSGYFVNVRTGERQRLVIDVE